MADPVNGEADAQPPEHGQIPSAVERTDPTFIFQCDNVEALMQAILDAPVTALVAEPRGGIVRLRIMGGQQKELLEGGLRLGRIVDGLLHFRALQGERKAHLLGAHRKAGDGSGFRAAFIDLSALRQIRR